MKHIVSKHFEAIVF